MSTKIEIKNSNKEMLDWQFRVILQQLDQIQLHASDATCPCRLRDIGEWCVPKHLNLLSSLANETAAMTEQHMEILFALAEEATDMHLKTKDHVCSKGKDIDIVSWSRSWRKKLEPIYYACSIKKAKMHDVTELAKLFNMTRAGQTVSRLAHNQEKPGSTPGPATILLSDTNTNIKKSEQLGMPFGTAQARLRKKILFNLLKRYGENVCYRCNQEIKTEDELSIEHKEPWLYKNTALFWDLNNIAFSHCGCNYGCYTKKGKGEIPHGTHSGYSYRDCRCEKCVEAHRDYMRKWREIVKSEKSTLEDVAKMFDTPATNQLKLNGSNIPIERLKGIANLFDSKSAKKERCIIKIKAKNEDKGCSLEGDGSKHCPNAFAVCQVAIMGKKAKVKDPELDDVARALKNPEVAPLSDVKECAKVICSDEKGKLSWGASSCGTISNVSVPIKCDSGCKAIAIVHNHPSGIPLPSSLDLKTASELKLTMCIKTSAPGVRCFKPKSEM